MEKQNAEESQKDTYPLNQIYFYLTKGCNLRCRHCWVAPKYQTKDRTYPALELDLFRSIIEQAKPMGLTGVKLTGGEPFIHPQIHDILDVIRSEDLNLNVETNGVLCTPELAGKIAGCRSPFVSVSLDGADAETHEWVRGVRGSFEAAQEGAHRFVEAGLRPQIIMAVMRCNKDQMEPVLRLAESLGANSVKFTVVTPTGRGEKLHEAEQTLTFEELVELGRWVEHELSATTRLPLIFAHPAAFRPLGKMLGRDGSSCGSCGILGTLGVLADGSYAMCGIGETTPDLIYGNAATDRLEEVWNSTPIIQELREGLPHRFEGICGECLMKELCLGFCVALNHYRAKNIWAPFWYCHEAHERGFFPESRLRPKDCPDRLSLARMGEKQCVT